MKLVIFISIAVALSISCSKDDNKSPTQPQAVSIELQSTHTWVRGYQGDMFHEKITAIVRDENDAVIAGIPVHFVIQDPLPWKGSLDQADFDTVTNERGEAYIDYNVTINQSGDVIIRAVCKEIIGFITIRIAVPVEFPILTIIAADPVLYVPADETRQTTVTAKLVAQDGMEMQGWLVLFRTNPSSIGFFDFDTATSNYNGQATRTFSSVANHYGVCTVSAMAGDSSSYTRIEIRPM